MDDIGDLDGDGVTELVVGAFLDDDGGTDKGAVYVLFMNLDGTVKSVQKISDTAGGFAGNLAAQDVFGITVAGLGDLDWDGNPDVAVGAGVAAPGAGNIGAIYVLFLNANGTVKAVQKTPGVIPEVQFARSLATLGDLDGDGVTDLVAGAPLDGDGGPGRGAVWILFLNADGTVKATQKISDTEGGFTGVLDDSDNSGFSAAGLGDLDGDGVSDLAVGAILDDDVDDGGVPLNQGAVWILFMNIDGTVKSHQKISDTAGNFGGTLTRQQHLRQRGRPAWRSEQRRGAGGSRGRAERR